jgi:hypothetical protein
MAVPNRDPLAEMVVAGGSRPSPSANPVILQREAEEVAQRNPGVWDKMLTDPAVSSAIDLLIESVMADGVDIVPAVSSSSPLRPDPAQDAQAERAEEIASFVRRALDGLSAAGFGVHDLCGELLMGLCYGWKAAEIVLAPGVGEDAGKLTLGAVLPRDGGRLGLVVDAYGRLVGIQGQQPGPAGEQPSYGMEVMTSPEQLKGFLPREKFVLFRNAGANGDPRGESILRPAYGPWKIKQSVTPEWFRYLTMFSIPGIIAKAPPSVDFEPELDENGELKPDGRMISVAQTIVDKLATLGNSTVVCLPHGTEETLVQSSGTGEAFLTAIDALNRQIHLAILGTPRASLEAEHGSKADSGEAQNVLRLRVSWIRKTLEETLERDIVRLLVVQNWGEEALSLAPKVVLSQSGSSSWADELRAVATAKQSGVLRDEQLPSIWARFGFPPADMEAVLLEAEDRMVNERLAAQERGRLAMPADPAEGM